MVLALATLASGPGAGTSAAGDRAEEQQVLLSRAAEAELGHGWVAAGALYRQAEAVLPESRLARRARARLEWLAAHAEGDFAPLTALASAMAAEPTHAVLADLERAVEGFPDGRVRREALAFLGDTYLRRLSDPVRALAAYRRLAELSDVTEGERQLAVSGAALAALALGEPARSVALLDEAGLTRRPEHALALAERWAEVGAPFCYALLGLFCATTFVFAGRYALGRAALRRAFAPGRLAVAAYALAAPVALLLLYDDDSGYEWRLALVLGAAGLVVATSALGAEGALRRGWSARRRAVLGAASSLAVCAAALLAVHHTGWLFRLIKAAGERP